MDASMAVNGIMIPNVHSSSKAMTIKGIFNNGSLLQRIHPVIVPTRSKSEVPLVFHEPHVETGFRQMNQPWLYYILSLFQKHNECINVWTHLMALVMVLYRTWLYAHDFDMLWDPYMWPLAAMLLTTILLYLFSSGAHCFSNRSELTHYTCFIIDYAGIGLYGLGSAIVHYWYCLHEDIFGTFPHRYAAPVGICLSTLVCTCCSISKTLYTRPYPFTRRIWQIGSVLTIYIWLIFPIWYKIYLYIFFGFWEPSLSHHIQQMFWFCCGGFFFGSDIPQRLFPGYFDFVGHSHQIFHLCILMTSYKQLDAVYLDIMDDKLAIYNGEEPTLLNTYGAVLLGLFINICLVFVFREVAKRKIHADAQSSTQRKE